MMHNQATPMHDPEVRAVELDAIIVRKKRKERD
jgi:hypothetical protein